MRLASLAVGSSLPPFPTPSAVVDLTQGSEPDSEGTVRYAERHDSFDPYMGIGMGVGMGMGMDMDMDMDMDMGTLPEESEAQEDEEEVRSGELQREGKSEVEGICEKRSDESTKRCEYRGD